VCLSQRADGASWNLIMAAAQAVLTSAVFLLSIRRGEGGLSPADVLSWDISARTHAQGSSPWRRVRSRVTVDRVTGGGTSARTIRMPPGVLDPHPGQSPGFRRGRPDDQDSGRGQPDVPGAGIPYLDPDHHRAPGRAHRVPGDPGQSRAGEKHHTRIIRGAELPVDSHAQDVAVETATAVQVARAQEDPPAQNIHATIPASR
jgi:hypothetical protein